MQPVQSCRLLLPPQIFCLKSCIVAICLWHTNAHTHTHGLTPDSGLIWSSVFTTTVHLEFTLRGPAILLRDYLRDSCLRYMTFPFGEQAGDKCFMSYPWWYVYFIFKQLITRSLQINTKADIEARKDSKVKSRCNCIGKVLSVSCWISLWLWYKNVFNEVKNISWEYC